MRLPLRASVRLWIFIPLRSRSLGPLVDRIEYLHYLLQADKAGSLRSNRDRVRAPTLPTHVSVVYVTYSLTPIARISQGKLPSLYSAYRIKEVISSNTEQADHFIPNPTASPPLTRLNRQPNPTNPDRPQYLPNLTPPV